MKLTPDQVKKVAKLANLPITAKEEEKYTGQLSKVLEYVEQLNKADTSSVEPTFNITGLSNVMREDESGESLTQDEALLNASRRKEGKFETKGVFEEE